LKYKPEEWENLSLDKVLKALNAECIPAGSGYIYPLYHNPLFKKIDFSKDSPFMKGRVRPIDYEEFKEKCVNAEKACNGHTIWLMGRLFLGTKKDIEDIVEGFNKIRKNIDELK
jgi:hypothetical protein